jgi:hypothetical protein
VRDLLALVLMALASFWLLLRAAGQVAAPPAAQPPANWRDTCVERWDERPEHAPWLRCISIGAKPASATGP